MKKRIHPRVLGCLVEAVRRNEELWDVWNREVGTSLYPIAQDPSGRGPREVIRRLTPLLDHLGRLWSYSTLQEARDLEKALRNLSDRP